MESYSAIEVGNVEGSDQDSDGSSPRSTALMVAVMFTITIPQMSLHSLNPPPPKSLTCLTACVYCLSVFASNALGGNILPYNDTPCSVQSLKNSFSFSVFGQL